MKQVLKIIFLSGQDMTVSLASLTASGRHLLLLLDNQGLVSLPTSTTGIHGDEWHKVTHGVRFTFVKSQEVVAVLIRTGMIGEKGAAVQHVIMQ